MCVTTVALPYASFFGVLKSVTWGMLVVFACRCACVPMSLPSQLYGRSEHEGDSASAAALPVLSVCSCGHVRAATQPCLGGVCCLAMVWLQGELSIVRLMLKANAKLMALTAETGQQSSAPAASGARSDLRKAADKYGKTAATLAWDMQQ